MSKFKAFFKKIKDYIKNTAWIQPILIVIVIFVVLFSLNPLTTAIKNGWTKLTSVNKMETISYGEYVEKVNEAADDEKFVVVFTSNDGTCADLFDSMNEFLKSDEYKSADFKVYNVDLSIKSATKKIDGKKYNQYKDSTIGLATTAEESNEEILAQDYLRRLDERVEAFVTKNYSGVGATGTVYNYITTPFFIWYEGGLETRMSNSWSATSDSSKSKFKAFITEFESDKDEGAEPWDEEFNLSYNQK